MTVSTPTVRRISVARPEERVPIGPDDYVLDSVYDHGTGAWELLVLVQPREDEEDDEDEE